MIPFVALKACKRHHLFLAQRKNVGGQNTCFGVKNLNAVLFTSLDSKKKNCEQDNEEGRNHLKRREKLLITSSLQWKYCVSFEYGNIMPCFWNLHLNTSL